MSARLPYSARFRHDLQEEVRRCRADLSIAPTNKRLFPMARQVQLAGEWTNVVDVYEIAIDGATGRDIGEARLLNDVLLFSVAEAMDWGLRKINGNAHTVTYRGVRAELLDAPAPPAPPKVRVIHRIGRHALEESSAAVASRFAAIGEA